MRCLRFVSMIALVLTVAIPTPASATGRRQGLNPYRNVVVIFQENHSFDNLYGAWGRVGRQRVEGVDHADAAHTIQVDQAGDAYACLQQNDVNLKSPPLPVTCPATPDGMGSAF